MSRQSLTEPVAATLIVTGYNQVDLIGAAIEGAFAQDYPRLQIIFADDASSDGTFERMQAAAQSYDGPHEVVVNRVAENRGTLGNIYEAVARATGELILLAGGDDISYPHRTKVTVERWLKTGADAYYARYDVIDATGAVIERDWKPDASNLALHDYFPGASIEPLHGASGACDRSVFERFRLPAARIRSEDAFITLMLGLAGGRTEFIDQTLVAYRRHSGAITNEVAPAPTVEAIMMREQTQMSFAASQRALLLHFIGEHAKLGRGPLAPQIRDDLALLELRSRWTDASIWERLRVLPAARRRSELDWLAPRLGGAKLFSTLKVAALKARAPRPHSAR